MVLALVLLPALAGVLGGQAPAAPTAASRTGCWSRSALTLVKVAAFGAIVLLLGPRVLPWVLRQVARTGSRELFTLAVLALSRSASPSARPSSSASRSRSARSSPASC